MSDTEGWGTCFHCKGDVYEASFIDGSVGWLHRSGYETCAYHMAERHGNLDSDPEEQFPEYAECDATPEPPDVNEALQELDQVIHSLGALT